MKPTLLFDPRLCVRCKRCQIDCATRNSRSGDLYEACFETPAPMSNMQIKTLAEGKVASASSCHHCEGDTAYCITNCPTEALFRDKETGLVLQDEEKCIYCGNCVTVCPYGAPRVKTEKKQKRFFKCDLCVERLAAGDQPACVSACHTHALTVKRLEAGQTPEPQAKSLEAVAEALNRDEIQAMFQSFTGQ